jgi:hypothetical protein
VEVVSVKYGMLKSFPPPEKWAAFSNIFCHSDMPHNLQKEHKFERI